jgi:DNA polymerase
VRRDIHKLKTHLRFRSLPDPQQPGQSMNMAWCEPSHHVVETIAPWFAKRHGPVRWTLFTPERIVFWDGRQLHYALGCSPLSSTSTDADWVSRWQAAFAKKDPLQ